ncbi:MAG: bifunctional deaminase-reductase domain protein [Flavipsychrobacter sp.]|nr:bifunctional deaminase-reductase domain protein [Flavipsychrobacter sp.]
MSRKLVLYIAMSLDGYIAAPNDDISFLTAMEKKGEDYGYAEFIKTLDTVILGRRTYDKIAAIGFSYPGSVKIYVITHTEAGKGEHYLSYWRPERAGNQPERTAG